MDANPFDQFDPSAPPLPKEPNPFDQFGPDVVAPPSSAIGAGGRAAERGIVPAAGGLAGMGLGAESGAALGLLGGPLAEVTVPVGGFVGGVAGALGGSYALSKVQDWALKSLPDSWQEALGQDNRQQQLDEKQHPTASFIGGIAPYMMTMSPVGAARAALPETATTLQRIMAHPATARAFGGAAMGGMELGQEKVAGQPVDWLNVAIATGLGVVFNRPNTLGSALSELGARPVRAALAALKAGTAQPPMVSAAAANDAKVIGPGVTEEVFQGTHEQSPASAQTAQQATRESKPAPEPDLHGIARRMEPETFTEYDNLSARRDALRSHIADIQNPSKQTFDDLKAKQEDITSRLAAHVEDRGGYTGGPEARQMRAQIRDIQTQIDTLTERKTAYAEGRGQENGDVAALRQQLQETDYKMRDMATQVSAAYRRAADAVDAGTVPGEPLPVARETKAPAEPVQGEAQPKAIDIARDVARQLTAAGRPADEALAAGQLVQAHYETRASRFGGKLGSPSNIYRNEGADIRAGRQPAATLELAQKQQKQLKQTARGKIRFANGAKPVISLMKNANASTFIHETGHQWLEELNRDAAHEAAPEGLKADAAAALKWLGAEDATKITTRQHEKFARGFEQYMREGIAPSPKLAGVFAKFRDWLVGIYRTLKGLGSPISEDIQGVFDRLIASEPQRTVIAPEHTLGPTLTDIHVADAIHTEPAEAEPAMDRVISETARYTSELPPEVLNELQAAVDRQAPTGEAAKSGSETLPGQGGSAEVGQGSGGQGTIAGGGTSGAEPGAVKPGGSEAGREGQSLAGRTGPEQLAPTPATVFGPKPSDFTDRAGNIRLDTLTSNEDVKAAIRDAAAENNDFIGERQGVVTDGQVMDLADALGMDFEQISTRKIGQAFNAVQVMAARKLLIQSATAVSDAMRKAAAGTDEDVMAYAEAKSRHQMIQGQVAGITAEAGRALRAFRNIAGQEAAQGIDQFLRGATGRTLFQLKEEARLGASLETPQQVSKFMRDAEKRTFGRMILEYWINGLISGPTTHSTYMVGNTILSLFRAGPETAVASAIGAGRAALGRSGERVRFGEVGAQLKGAAQGLAPALKATAESLRTGVTSLLPGEKARSLPFQPDTATVGAYTLNENATFRDAAISAFGLVRGLRDGVVAAGTLAKGGIAGSPFISARYSPLGQTPDIAVRGVTVLPLGTAVRLPSRFIAAIHTLFRSINYSMDKNAQAYRTAAEEGLSGQAFDARVAEVRANPPEAVMENARNEATQLTLMGKGGAFTQTLARLTNTEILGFPLFKFIDPFVKIGSNIIDQAILQRTPAGILSPEIRADLMGKNGNIAQDKAQARMVAGTAMALTFGSLAAEGLMSGSEPPDRNQAAMWRLAGNQAHSVRIGDIWYDVHRLGPLGMLAGMTADMYDVAQNAEKGEYLTAASELQHAFTQNILDESFMRGPADLIKAIEDPGRYGESYIRNFISSFTPYSVGMGQIARAMDPYSRRARTTIDAIKAKVPGLSQTLMPNRDIWGEPLPSRDALGGAGVTAIYEVRASRDPVNLAMMSLGIYPAPVDKKIRNVELTPQQYDDYSRIAGRMAKLRLDTIVNSPDFRSWPAQSQHDVLSEVIRQSRETARGIMMMKNPSLVQAAYAAKTARVTGLPPQ